MFQLSYLHLSCVVRIPHWCKVCYKVEREEGWGASSVCLRAASGESYGPLDNKGRLGTNLRDSLHLGGYKIKSVKGSREWKRLS